MTQKHTPEPWAIHEDASGDIFISGSDHTYIAEIGNPDEDGSAADARRIVACVNAMAGIGDDNALFFHGNSVRSVISSMKIKERDLESQRDNLQVQVNELLEELIITLGSLEEICSVRQIPRPESTIRRAETAINKITGETK